MTTLEGTRDFFVARQKQILLGLLGGGIAALLFFGLYYYSAHQNEKAKDQLSRALEAYHANQGQNPASTDPSIKSSTERYEKALVEFRKVTATYPSRPAGKISQYYAGLCLRGLNKNKEAMATLEPLSAEKSDYGALALVALASLHEESGNLVKSTDLYQQIINRNSPVTPKGFYMMHLAELYQQQGKSSEAAKVYQQVVKDFPASSFVTEAEQKLKEIAR
jgi:tetratricopeptide (TPR) repeat protein